MKFKPETKIGKVLIHLQSGRTITPKEAWNLYGYYRLSSGINKLNKDVYDIENIGDYRFAEYTLNK